MDLPKILFFDIESAGVNGLKSDLGYILCFGYKWAGEKTTKVIKISQFRGFKRRLNDDKELLKEAYKLFEQADFTVAHYGEYFDKPFIQGRLAINGLPPLPPQKLIDTCLLSRKHLKNSSNRLKHLAKILNCDQLKADNNWPHDWFAAMRGDTKAIDRISTYCQQDVRTLESVYNKIKPYCADHPHVGVYRGLEKDKSCKVCGEAKLVKHKHRISAQGAKKQQYQCKGCGAYSTYSIKK